MIGEPLDYEYFFQPNDAALFYENISSWGVNSVVDMNSDVYSYSSLQSRFE